MTDQPAATDERHYHVTLDANPYARTPLEAYLMTVDSLIRFGADNFHPIVTEVETGQRWMYVDGQMVTGDAFLAALDRLEAMFAEEASDGSPDGS